MSINSWLKNWHKPSNLIALTTLIVTAFGVWGGVKFFNNNQVIRGEKGCDISKVEQLKTSDSNSNQSIICSESTIEDIKQENN